MAAPVPAPPTSTTDAPQKLYDHEELFEVFDEKTVDKCGTEKRGIVHRKGLLHKSVNVWIINKNSEVLLQKRHKNKSICPGHWDLSCAEHLQPGEDYLQAAIRGLKEELGIEVEDKALKTLREQNRKYYSYPSLNIIDNELTMLYSLSYDGSFKIDTVEVSEILWIPMSELKEDVDAADSARRKRQYTPWCLDDARFLPTN
eukprot:CAMPEP_0114526062 /NCGR_PEP_ID=MMETSP0109-20121206/22794_1 /TAXON_ID=29199 /ORGANISM="Chlorarachnion reptans, Strain CCCM449" /LENGTH=200 /DNA_ID=CAMNT_0001707759 /DNA_START=234 /DNA_END=836 /DNA_ORIENTATION=-